MLEPPLVIFNLAATTWQWAMGHVPVVPKWDVTPKCTSNWVTVPAPQYSSFTGKMWIALHFTAFHLNCITLHYVTLHNIAWIA